MGHDVLEAAGRQVAASGQLGDQLTVVWHAGEPLVLPISWYEEAIERLSRQLPAGLPVQYLFQTNATLVTPAWIEFFRRPDVSVGVSMDGPRALHDRNRMTRSGSGTFTRVVDGLAQLTKAGIDFRVITVLTRESLFFPDELYDFYVEHRIRQVCFNIEEIEGVNTRSSLQDARGQHLYRRFLARFLMRMRMETTISSLREMDQLLGFLSRPKGSPVTNEQSIPFGIVSVAANGDFAMFSPELLGVTDERWGDFVLGNVLSGSLRDVAELPKYKAIAAEIAAGIDRCRNSCDYFEVCGGGAPANKVFETGRFDATETLYCRYAVKATADVVMAAIQEKARMQEASLLSEPSS